MQNSRQYLFLSLDGGAGLAGIQYVCSHKSEIHWQERKNLQFVVRYLGIRPAQCRLWMFTGIRLPGSMNPVHHCSIGTLQHM